MLGLTRVVCLHKSSFLSGKQKAYGPSVSRLLMSAVSALQQIS